MKFLSLFILISFIWFGQAQSYPEKFQVCTMTLSSSDEANLFQQYLSDSRFDFVELVPSQVYEVSDESKSRWLTKACHNPDIRCDMLIVSGHFAGIFFGTDHHYTLPLSELEQLSCQNRCANVLQNLKEVFLFGCNTMAHKGVIGRSPEEYLSVLLDYEIPQNIAETIVAGRFSNLDFTYKEKMESVFSSRTKLYGFTELSPLGSQGRSSVSQYLEGVKGEYGSYYQYLVKNFYTQPNKEVNHHFKKAFSPISQVEQSYGMSESNPRYPTFQKMCKLYSNQASVSSRLQVVKSLFEEGEVLTAFSAIKNFLQKHKKNFSQQDQKVFQEIRLMEVARQKLQSAFVQLSDRMVYVRSSVLHFLNIMNWIAQADYQNYLRNLLIPFVEKPTLQSLDILDALVKHDGIKNSDISIGYNDFPIDYFNNIWSILVVDILGVSDDKMQKRLVAYCQRQLNARPVICYQVLKTLGHLKVSDQEVLNFVAQFLDHEDDGLTYYATYSLAYSGVKDPHIQLGIVQNLYHKDRWVRLQSLRSLDYMDLISRHFRVYERVVDMLKREEDEEILKTGREILGKFNR